MTNIGKISKISIRDEFPNEARNFTPWLKEHLPHIGEKLHLTFSDDVETEVPVGGYSCDVLAHTIDGRIVVIENQFGDADHDHLGKILTYAATLEADILIWISENFRREHINALNWLNTIAKSYNSPSFFALKIELIKIEDSKPALSITPIVQPPNWSNQNKTAGITRNRNKKEKQYHEFWSQFIPYFDSVKSGFKNKKPPYHSWISFPSPSSKMHYSIYFESGKYPTIALYISGGTAEENKNFFEKIKTHQAELKSKFPDLDWYDLPKNKSKSIDLYRKEEYDFSEEKRDDVMNWLKQNIQEFEKAFNPIIKNL